MAIHRDFDPEDLYKKAAQVNDMLRQTRESFSIPEIHNVPSQYDLTGNSEIVAALQEQRNENARLSKRNTRLTYLSIFLAALPVIFGLWSLYQTQQSNELMERQLDQFEAILERSAPKAEEPVYGPFLP